MSNVINSLKTAIKEDRLVALVTVMTGGSPGNKLLVWPDGRTEGSLGSDELDHQAASLAAHQMKALESGRT
ncbi:MAG TPA: XdhC family protein, partial [Anaerolineaceae bacterium]|nr:XdhC family protein [Anaerolineaceae bacterium]